MDNHQISITVNGVTTLATAGKYCDRNIDVAVNVGNLDTSDATATAADIANGKTAYVNGVKVEGTIPHENRAFTQAPKVDGENVYLQYDAGYEKRIVGDGAQLKISSALSNFGDATAADVAAGKTFTSAAGLKITGTGGGASLPEGAVAIQIVTAAEASTQVGSGYSLSIKYGDAVKITDSIALGFAGTSSTLSNISESTDFSVLSGKYISTGSGTMSTTTTFYYIPSGASFTVGGSTYSKTLTCDKAQKVSMQKVSL